MFLNGNAIADELPNIQFSLTTILDTSLPGIQTYFIYLSWIIGKLLWNSIEKFGFQSKFSLYSSRQSLRTKIILALCRFVMDISGKCHVCVADIR